MLIVYIIFIEILKDNLNELIIHIDRSDHHQFILFSIIIICG
jgi:hypothetical protein